MFQIKHIPVFLQGFYIGTWLFSMPATLLLGFLSLLKLTDFFCFLILRFFMVVLGEWPEFCQHCRGILW